MSEIFQTDEKSITVWPRAKHHEVGTGRIVAEKQESGGYNVFVQYVHTGATRVLGKEFTRSAAKSLISAMGSESEIKFGCEAAQGKESGLKLIPLDPTKV